MLNIIMYSDIICRSPTSTDESLIYSSTTAIFNCVQIAFFPSAFFVFAAYFQNAAWGDYFSILPRGRINFLDAPSKHRLRNAERVVRCDRVTSMLTMSSSPPRATIHPHRPFCHADHRVMQPGAHLPLQPGTWPQVSTASPSLPSAWPPTLPQEPQCSRIRDVEIMWLECFHPASRNQVLRIVYLRGRRPQTNILF